MLQLKRYITDLLSNPDKVEVGIALLGLGDIEWGLFPPSHQPEGENYSYLTIVSSIFREENAGKLNYKRYYDMLKEHLGGDDSFIPDEFKPARLGLSKLVKRSIKKHIRELPTFDAKTREIQKIIDFLGPEIYAAQFPEEISYYGGNINKKRRSVKQNSRKRNNKKYKKNSNKYSGGSRYKRKTKHKSKNKNRKLKSQRKQK